MTGRYTSPVTSRTVRLSPGHSRHSFALRARAAVLRAGWALACAAALSPPVLAANGNPSPLVSPSTDHRVAQARARGYWVVEEGEYLYRISRYFAVDEADANRLVKELRALNENALIQGDASRLVVGARLRLPDRLLDKRAAPASKAEISPAAPGSAEVRSPVEGPGKAGPTPTPPPGIPPATAVPPIAQGASPPEPQAIAPATPPAPAYVDRLIDARAGEEPELTLQGRPREGSPGLRTWAAELRTDTREASGLGTSNAQALGVRLSQETAQYGNFTLVGQASHFTSFPGDPLGEKSRFDGTLFQDEFALGTSLLAANAAGIVRPLLPSWLSTSYRISLSPSLLTGATTTVTSDGGGDYRAAIGGLGRYAGFGIQQFERTSGSQASIAGSQRFGDRWQAGGAAISVRGNAETPDHTAGIVGLLREGSRPGSSDKLVLGASDNGERAAWLDGYARAGRLSQRYGFYHVDPKFTFGESTTTRDTRGGYWRGDYRAGGHFYGGGIEFTQDNLRRDPTRGGYDSAGAFGNLSLRLDRATQLGGGLSLRNEEPRVAGTLPRLVGQANAFVSRAFPVGQTRLDWTTTSTRPDGGVDERTNAANWNQEWPRLGPIDLSTLLGWSDERLTERRVKRKTASLTARGIVFGNVRWDSTVTFVDLDDTAGSERNYNASLGLDWNPTPDWTLALTWYRNRVQPGPDNPLAPFTSENSLQLRARYEGSSGIPYPRTEGASRSGTGTVAGSVFFDENADGVRQPTERGAANVVVILDDRRSATSDPEGRFSFTLVPAGRHRVRILVERLPLPWGLEDDSPREVNVEVRSEARVEVGLTKIGP